MAKDKPLIRVLTSLDDFRLVDDLQLRVWGDDGLIPDHLWVAATRHGALLMGAFVDDRLAGFVFGFPALESQKGRLKASHHSHMLGVDPEFRDQGIGFALKRAQWQLVRKQGLDEITWTYDPLQSRNAYLNIARLGAVCSSYFEDYYGEMADEINRGYPSDRFQVSLWVNTPRVQDRFSDQPRGQLGLGDYFSAGAEIVNPTRLGEGGFPELPDDAWSMAGIAEQLGETDLPKPAESPPFYLVEIPPDIQAMKKAAPELALRWRMQTRKIFKELFAKGYLVTDFIYMRGDSPRSFYLLSDGERQIGAFRKK